MRVRAIACLAASVLVASPVSSQIPVQTQPGAPVPGATQTLPPRANSAKTGTAILRGHVVAADSGQPLRKAQVRLSPATPTGGLPNVRGTSTDKNGAFEFKEVAAGRYMLNAEKGSYVALGWGQRRTTDPGTPLEVLDGQTIEKLDFSLPRGAILTGRIIDEFGDAAPDVLVSALRTMVVNGQRRLIQAGRSSTTNDIGEFRVFGLAPGQYYLSATYRGLSINQESDDRSGYAPTYYPGSPILPEAQRVAVALGQTIADLNMQLVPTRTARISGVALDSSGKPLSGAPILITQRNENLTGGFTSIAQLRPDGTFTASGLAPGEYNLQSLSSVNTIAGGPEGEFVSATVTVNGEDINGLQLIGVRPSTITGRIVLPNTAAAGAVTLTTVRLVAPSRTPDFGPAPSGTGRINDDFSFEIKSPPGTRVIALNVPPPGWSLKAVRINGVDVTDRGFEVKPAQDQSGFEIELTNQLTTVSGLVTNARGEHSTDYTVVFFAQDREKWQPPNRFFRVGRPDQDGRFKLSGLPAGEYYAIASDSLDPNETSDPEVLDRISGRATSFSLNDGENKVLDLRLTTGL